MHLRLSPYLILLITAFFWAGNFIVVRATHEVLPPITLAFWRWVLAVVVLLPFTARDVWAHAPVIRHHWLLLAILSATGIVLYQVFSYTALNATSAINVSLINSIMPIVIPVMAFAINRDRVTPRQMAGFTISLAGALIVIARGDAAVLFGLQFAAGDLWMLAAVAASALYSVLHKRLPARLPLAVLLTVIALMGLPMLLPLYVWEYSQLGGFEMTAVSLSVIAYVGGFASIIAYLGWSRGVIAIGATRAGLFIHVITVFTVLMGVTLLGEDFHLFHLAGISLIITGVYLAVVVPARDYC